MRIARILMAIAFVAMAISCDINKQQEQLIPRIGVDSLSASPSAVLVAPMSAAQLTLTVSPTGAAYEWIKWSSSDNTIASVDEYGKVVGNKDGKCTITASSDNGKTATCTVFVCKTPITTKNTVEVGHFPPVLCGSFNVTGAESLDKTVFFLYSDTESSLEGLKTKGTQIVSSMSAEGFKIPINQFNCGTEYYFAAGVTFLGQTYYGEVNNFTTQSLPEGPIDLGLSVKWASANIGANKPWESGRYFAWGDVVGQTWDGSSWSGYGFMDYPDYKLDENNNLKPEYDAAHVLIGDSYRMPTQADFEELIYGNCSKTWTKINGVAGMLFSSYVSGSERFLFLPAVGYGDYDSLSDSGTYGYYWTSSFSYDDYDEDEAAHFWVMSNHASIDQRPRSYGFPIRPVSE